jgi:hypothetical protein
VTEVTGYLDSLAAGERGGSVAAEVGLKSPVTAEGTCGMGM